jgi:predicted nucleic-acid-binding Zn-ribbon protein
MKECIACHSGQIKQVDIVPKDGVLTFIEKSEIIVSPQSQKIIKFVCLNCGFINLYAEDYF